MGNKYVNEFIYFDMLAGIRRLKAEESILNGYSDIDKLKEVTESIIFEHSEDSIDSIIDRRLSEMECGTGQCIRLNKLDEVYTEPHIEVLGTREQLILSKQDSALVKDILKYEGSNEAIALDSNHRAIKIDTKNTVERYIKERMKKERYIDSYYIIDDGRVYRITTSILKKPTNNFAIKQSLYRYILFGIIGDSRIEKLY